MPLVKRFTFAVSKLGAAMRAHSRGSVIIDFHLSGLRFHRLSRWFLYRAEAITLVQASTGSTAGFRWSGEVGRIGRLERAVAWQPLNDSITIQHNHIHVVVVAEVSLCLESGDAPSRVAPFRLPHS